MKEEPEGSESGAVIVLVAILLPVLLGMAALALDIGNWYLRAQREQKAADAAALAGAVYLPGDPTTAFSVAKDLAVRNGYTDGQAATQVSVSQDNSPSRLRVTISQTQNNFFGSILGLVSTRISRTAVSEYQGPAPMGSPNNTFGNEPLGGNDTKAWSTGNGRPQFWANIAGPHSVKYKGDAHQAGSCSFEDGCSSGTNTDYSPNGYFYAVHVPTPPAGKKLSIQIFDPAFVNVGDLCDRHLDNATSSTNPYVSDPSTRYVKGAGTFCTGDQLFTDTGDGKPPTTSYIVRAPTSTPWDPLSAPVVSTPTCKPTQFPGYDEDLAGPLKAAGGDPALQQVFRQWVTVCTIDTPVAGDYLLQARTDVRLGSDPAGPADLTTPGEGHNRFALRAAFLDAAGTPDGAGVRIFATTTMAIYVNATSASTQFHLVRVPSGSGGRVLALSFFDIGDASQPGKLRIVSSDTTLSNCTATGPQSGTLATCVVNADSTFNGRWERVSVPIPAGYTCNDGDPNACWIRIQYDYGTGTIPSDTTTWSAAVEGDPVRLVE